MIVTMPYLAEVSKNSHKWRKTRGTKASVKSWMNLLAIRAEPAKGFQKYNIGVKGFFWSENRPDMQNLTEVISDALQEGLGVNDKHFRFRDDGYELGYSDQRLEISIEGKDE